MKNLPQSGALEPEKLRPLLHEKIEHMTGNQLSLFNRVLLQLEAEELAERLGDDFDKDHNDGKFHRIAELIRQFRTDHRYA